MTITAIIVNYNAGPALLEAVGSVLSQGGRVVVVDNASSDGSLAQLTARYPAEPRLSITRNDSNLGFAKACNIGAMQAASGEYLLFLNPDCSLQAGALSALERALEINATAGMAGPLLLNPDGSEQPGGRRFFPTPLRALARAFLPGFIRNRLPFRSVAVDLHRQPLPAGPTAVDAISGACMLVRPTAIAEIGLWDEDYFLHCEDLDWCMRFHRRGWDVIFVPEARVLHGKGGCSASRPVFVEWHKHRGMMRFYRKFYRAQYPWVLMALVGAGVWIRFVSLAGLYGLKRLWR